VADLVGGALDQGEHEYRLYDRFAWVIMPNHVHVVMRPFRPLPEVTRWIKGSTARSANLLLERTGKPFWQYETSIIAFAAARNSTA
jgi:REP element-mobilizing transposase RayT